MTASQTLTGKVLSPGMAEGPVYQLAGSIDVSDHLYDIDTDEVEWEQIRLTKTLDVVVANLGEQAERVRSEMNRDWAAVFEAHQMMLQDGRLKDDLLLEIATERVSAAWAVRTVFKRWIRTFSQLDSERMQQKTEDLQDLANRFLRTLAGIGSHRLDAFPSGAVLVAQRLMPSDTMILAKRSAAAVILEQGGKGSHAALFARETGLPCIGQVADALKSIPEGRQVLVDAHAGKIYVDPTESETEAFRAKAESRNKEAQAALSKSRKSAVTQDGLTVPVMANIGNRADAELAIRQSADGVGLYRVEQYFLTRQTPPNEEELVEAMHHTLEPFQGKEICIRLLDLGADKQLPFMETREGKNPALGLRGIRFLQAHPSLLETQCAAICRLASALDVRVLVPMVCIPEDLQVARKALQTAADALGLERVPPLGAMIETPAAALSAHALSAHADFFSIGTNDLTQYTFAVDRENDTVDDYFDDTHPAIRHLIREVHRSAPETEISVCGELANNLELTQDLLQCGVRKLSVAPPMIPDVKEAVRRSDWIPAGPAFTARLEPDNG